MTSPDPALIAATPATYDDLSAVYLNCTLKRGDAAGALARLSFGPEGAVTIAGADLVLRSVRLDNRLRGSAGRF